MDDISFISLISNIFYTSIISWIEPDREISLSACNTQSGVNYNLARISATPGVYKFNSVGAGVKAYVIDSGIYTAHTEFGGRASFGANFVGGTNDDCNGHGTFVAGIIGSNTYGVAKGVRLISVKVFDCTGSGSVSGIISGINWVASQCSANPTKCTVNLSAEGPLNVAITNAATSLVLSGVTLVVAAGNHNTDVVNVSPASTPTAITVGSFDNTDKRDPTSNYGALVDIFAPGVNILSTYIGDPSALAEASGTSMAAPHVTGVVARYLSEGNFPPPVVQTRLLQDAQMMAINMNCGGVSTCMATPNVLLRRICT